jgi:hypothetical protein
MEKEVLKDLHILSNIFENLGYAKEAQVVNEVFVKVAKTKAKKKKNVPTNPSLWSECKAWAKRTFDVYPSAYANGAAAKRYKSKGGGWKKASSDSNMRLADLSTPDGLSFEETPTTYFTLPGGTSDQAIEKNPQLIYQTAINQIKKLIVTNQKDDANKVYSYYFNGTDLNTAQKQALQNQYNSILDRFTSKDQDFNLSNPMAQQYLLEEDTKANTYVANFIKRLGILRTQITNNSRAFNEVSKMISTIKDINIRYKAIDVLKGIVNMNSQTLRVKP